MSYVFIQCVRSCGHWSIGTSTSESSIQNAYLQMIEAAKRYIYIEVKLFKTKIDRLYGKLFDFRINFLLPSIKIL